MLRAQVLRALAALIIAAAALPCLAAFPEKPIRIIIPFSAGASADSYARVVASKLTERLGQPVLVEARPGANGIIATELVAKAPADGYTLLLANSSFSINQAVYRKLPFDSQRDFIAIGSVVNATGMVLVAHPSLPARNVAELIALARATPDRIAFGSAGTGNILHLAGETFNVMAGVRLLHVPYKGAAPALTDVLAGQVQLMWNGAGQVLAHIRSGKLRPIAVSSLKRAPELPDVPTFDEAGVPGYNVTSWFGLLAPVATPAEIVRKLRADTEWALQQPDARAKLTALGAEPPVLSAEEFAGFIKADATSSAKIVKAIGLAADSPQ